MTNLIDKRTKLRIMKKNNKLMYNLYKFHLLDDKYIYILSFLLILYFTFRFYTLRNKKSKDVDNMADVKFNKKYDSYSIKNNTKLSENNYLEKYMKMPNKVRPIPNKIINYM